MDARLHDLVARAAAATPDAPAIRARDACWSYRELDARSSHAAAALRALGVGRGDRVVLWGDKGPRLVAAMQGALRLGAAYVPLAAGLPAARAAAIARDCGAAAIVADRVRLDRLAAGLPAGAVIDAPPLPLDEWDTWTRGDEAPPPAIGADDLAYILYTSGSTGVPKGVCLSHRNALAFVEWAAAAAAVRPDSRLANHAAFSFDLSVLDLYAAFHGGASVAIVGEDEAAAPAALVELIARERITIWYSVPSALMLMIDHGRLLERRDLALETVLFAGEVFPLPHLRRLREAWPETRLLNLYGPTETNVCAAYEVTAIDPLRTAPVPIGQATCGDRLWIADEEGRVLTTAGAEGQLWVDGPTVMLGYWGQPPQGGRPYATGDICRLDADGGYTYVGRRDRQVKVRGHRVELGEIEAVLAAHPAVAEAAVTLAGEGADSRLIAWVAPRQAAAPSLIALKTHCAAHLPAYMTIHSVIVAPALPRTPNGKIDRARLDALGREAAESGAGGAVRAVTN